MDPLSDVLALLKPTGHMFRGFEAGGAWSIRFDGREGIRCYAVFAGACWLAVDGVDAPVELSGGDCVLLMGGRSFRLASDLSAPDVDAFDVFTTPANGGVVVVGGGGEVSGVGGYFTVADDGSGVLLGTLPPLIVIRRESDKAALIWSMDRMRQELREDRPGGVLVLQHLAQMMLVEALRAHLGEGRDSGVGWLFALADRRMAAALGAMHRDPARRWTLRDLAERAGMSRSAFAARFKETVGSAPLDYLTRWRMLLAAERLTRAREPIAALAPALGYESESAFSAAFKRVMGRSPRQYARERGAEAAKLAGRRYPISIAA